MELSSKSVLLDNAPALDKQVTRLFKLLRELEAAWITLKYCKEE